MLLDHYSQLFCTLIPYVRQLCYVTNHPNTESESAPIRVAPKPKSKSNKKARNVFYDDRGYPDESDEYDSLLHNIDGGVILQKRSFPHPPSMWMTLHLTTHIPWSFMASSCAHR